MPVSGAAGLPRFPVPHLPRIPKLPNIDDIIVQIPKGLPYAARVAAAHRAEVARIFNQYRNGTPAQRIVHRAACNALGGYAALESTFAYDFWAQAMYDNMPSSLQREYDSDADFRDALDYAVGEVAGRLKEVTPGSYLRENHTSCE